MRSARLKAGVWAQAFLRRCSGEGVGAYVVRRGDEDAGLIIVKHVLMAGASQAFIQTRNEAGELYWREAKRGPEFDIDAYIERERNIDPDIWVIEVEAREGAHYFSEPVVFLEDEAGKGR